MVRTTTINFIGLSVYNRFNRYLKDVGLDDAQTFRNLRAGCSITLELLGIPKSGIAKHFGWRIT